MTERTVMRTDTGTQYVAAFRASALREMAEWAELSHGALHHEATYLECRDTARVVDLAADAANFQEFGRLCRLFANAKGEPK